MEPACRSTDFNGDGEVDWSIRMHIAKHTYAGYKHADKQTVSYILQKLQQAVDCETANTPK